MGVTVNTKQAGEREHTCLADYWLNELWPSRRIWSAPDWFRQRLMLANSKQNLCCSVASALVRWAKLLIYSASFSEALLLWVTRSEKCNTFICHHKLMRCGNNDGIYAVSLPSSCCFSSRITHSRHASELVSISFVTLTSSLSFDTLSLFLFFSSSLFHSLTHSLGPETAQQQGNKSLRRFFSCSQQPPSTNKSYLLLWPSLEE